MAVPTPLAMAITSNRAIASRRSEIQAASRLRALVVESDDS
jgi:hypothetical protein